MTLPPSAAGSGAGFWTDWTARSPGATGAPATSVPTSISYALNLKSRPKRGSSGHSSPCWARRRAVLRRSCGDLMQQPMKGRRFFYRETDGIRITVRPEFLPDHSDPPRGRYVFTYFVRIE